MGSTTQVTGTAQKHMVMEFMSGRTEINMWESGINVLSKDSVMITLETVMNMRGLILKESFMAEADLYGKTVCHMKECLKTE